MSEKSSESVPKKRGRLPKTASEKSATQKDQSAPKPSKAGEAGQQGKRPRGRPPGEGHVVLLCTACCAAPTRICLYISGVAGTGKKQKAAAAEAAAEAASKHKVNLVLIADNHNATVVTVS